MKIGKFIKYICLLIILPVCASCNFGNAPFNRSPKQILTGTKEGEDTNYIYYSINGGNEYAVGLTETGKNQTTLPDFPTMHNNKPVTGIWNAGFHDSKCTSLTLHSNITVIDYEAFMESQLTTITIPSSVYAIGESAFYSCKQLTKVVIQNTSSSSQASSACSCIEPSTSSPSGSSSSNPSSSSSTPSSSSSSSNPENEPARRLTNIPALCFFGCNSLKEVVFPETIKVIGEEAFHGCTSLRSTIAFMSIEKICYRAFQGCSSLKKVYISSSFFAKDSNNKPIGVIEDKAFDSCNSGLVFYLIGNVDDIATWRGIAGNRNWNQKNALINPGDPINPETTSSTRYTYFTPGENSGAVFTNDWIYTIDQNNEVDINSYIGPTELNSEPIKFISFPDNFDGKIVRTISRTALDSVKSHLERIYLPKQLRRIEGDMFDGSYLALIVVDANTECSHDEDFISDGEQTLTGRIVLNSLTDLEIIGSSAFVNMPHLADIKKLYLPYSLKGVGTSAFGSSSANGKHMKGVTDFQWDYDDEKSALEVIGKEAFYQLGRTDNNKDFTSGSVHQGHIANNGTSNYNRYELTTLVIPRTFRHFGITSNDTSVLPGLTSENDDDNFGCSAFAGCPLLSKVVFKGSKQTIVHGNPNSSYVDNDTFDLVLASKTFAMNESLRTVVFEERVNKNIVFNTCNGYNQPVIGWSSGKKKNDFGGDPTLQTLVLPNKYTTLRIQNNAFIGNSRGVIYFSAATDSNIKGSTTKKVLDLISNPARDGNVGLPTDWRKIGKDSSGYNFTNQNFYGLNQRMPMYGSVLYKDTIFATDDVIVGYGNTNLFLVKDNCAFVTNGSSNATMTNYLYDRYNSFAGTVTIPYQVGTNNLPVVKIGDSAFSADYCESTSYANVTGHSDVTAVKIPDTVTSIGEYAFMRAYNIASISSYHVNTGGNDEVDTGTTYENVMPSKVTSIGKHAFAFCNIKKILKIPNNCVFYENSNASDIEGTNLTSVFSNNFSLRQITFLNSSNVESTSSAKYTTTTYTHTGTIDNNVLYTSAIYSTTDVSKNKKTLSLVLNRDTGNDRVTASDDFTVEQGAEFGTFNGRYGYTGGTVTQYLYGAFKMCYWVESLILGNPNSMALNQPLISGLYDKTNNVGKKVYLEESYNFVSDKASNLKTVAFSDSSEAPTSISTPPYSFAGCDKLTSITLPRIEQSGATIPAGLFASIGNPDVKFRVPQYDEEEEEYYYDECDKGVLDLTHTNYSGIDAEAFKNTSITKVIAPIVTDFTIEMDAFAGCTKLNEIDFSNVTGNVILNGSFRGATISANLFNFGSSAKIIFGNNCFENATFSDESFELPIKTAKIGDSCFENCNTLKTVTAENDDDLVYLDKVTVQGGTAQDNNIIFDESATPPASPPTSPSPTETTTNRGGYRQIGNYAFYKCNNLQSFPFSKFTNLERIGHYAFSMNTSYSGTSIKPDSASPANNAKICAGGVVELPASLTNLGVGAFNGSMITEVTIKSTEFRFERGSTYTTSTRAKINLGGHQFEYCSALKTVIFTEPDCVWMTPYVPKGKNATDATGQDNYFSHCANLEIVNLPRTYDMEHWEDSSSAKNNYRPDSMVYESAVGVRFYLHHTLNDWTGAAICHYWHNQGQNYDNLVFYVGSITDVANLGSNDVYTLKTLPKSDQDFWAMIDDEMVYIGTIDGFNQDGTGVVFSEGYIATSSGVSVHN